MYFVYCIPDEEVVSEHFTFDDAEISLHSFATDNDEGYGFDDYVVLDEEQLENL